jgi:hypothetical protein
MAVMPGVLFSQTLPNGVTTTWSTFIDISWQPMMSANVQVGNYLSEAAFEAGDQPVSTFYYALNIGAIAPTGNIPLQILTQLTTNSDSPLLGGTITTT